MTDAPAPAPAPAPASAPASTPAAAPARAPAAPPAAAEPLVAEKELVQGTSLWRDAWKRLRRNRMAVAASVLVAVVVVFSLCGPWLVYWIAGWTIDHVDISYGARSPSWSHPFGTDLLGRDLLVRVMAGGAISLMVGAVATSVSLVVGVLYGAVAGYAGGRVDALMTRFVDIMMSLPYILLVIVLMAVLKRSLVLLFAALGLVSWLVLARIVRGQVLSLKNREFVEAARALGVPWFKIVTRHLIPNTLGPVIVYTTLTLPSVMLYEAFLSFLGLGVREPLASWGSLVKEGAEAMVVYPWMLVFPALVMGATLFCLNFLGDGLRDALDPQLRTVRSPE
ncbi:MAG TPA: ABC transporter permease [Myxococcota bacterium]|nr:ABC transporter permease [Myxococcota bacterium]